jgi:hypothetical protein
MGGYSQSTFLTPAGVSPPPYHWTAFWIVPAILSTVALLMFKVLFRTDTDDGKLATTSLQ